MSKHYTKKQQDAKHQALGCFLCNILGKNPNDWKSLEAGLVPMTNSQEVHPLSPPSNKIYFTKLRNINATS